jgi:class 3 adenylate cyclase
LEAHRVERKLSAIFAADVEGYSRLMELDEVGTLRTLTAYRVINDRLITSHRGRIFNTAGDSRQVRSRLAAGGSWIRTLGPPSTASSVHPGRARREPAPS